MSPFITGSRIEQNVQNALDRLVNWQHVVPFVLDMGTNPCCRWSSCRRCSYRRWRLHWRIRGRISSFFGVGDFFVPFVFDSSSGLFLQVDFAAYLCYLCCTRSLSNYHFMQKSKTFVFFLEKCSVKIELGKGKNCTNRF